MGIGCFTIYIIVTLLFIIPLLFARMITGAFVTLGFTPDQAFFLLAASLFGAFINIPVKIWPGTQHVVTDRRFLFPHLYRFVMPRERILAVNVGGAVIPGAVSLWEIYRMLTEFNPYVFKVFMIVAAVNTAVCYVIARPVENKGIALPAFIPPLIVSFLSLVLAAPVAPLVAFPAGVLGVLVGADLMHLKDIKRLVAPMGSIGGAGTFDGIFLCGILSVFLTG